MFSKEYLIKLSETTGFKPDSLQRQMTLIELLREVNRHPLLGKQYVLKGGTAINLFWFPLPRLSVDIDLNYIGSSNRETMLRERPTLEEEIKKLIKAKGITVENAPAKEHAGGKWRLRAPNAFGGSFTVELDLNYIMRTPVWGAEIKRPYSLDDDYLFECRVLSFEELFAGKCKALLDRSAARDLYDAHKLSKELVEYDKSKLRKTLTLFGLTCIDDWRKKDFSTIDEINLRMIDQELTPLLRLDEPINLEKMKAEVKVFLTGLMKYDKNEKLFIDRFLDNGVYEPELIFDEAEKVEELRHHPALLWKLKNHREHLGLDRKT